MIERLNLIKFVHAHIYKKIVYLYIEIFDQVGLFVGFIRFIHFQSWRGSRDIFNQMLRLQTARDFAVYKRQWHS